MATLKSVGWPDMPIVCSSKKVWIFLSVRMYIVLVY